MKLSQRLQDERRFIEAQCGTGRICDRCWATLRSQSDFCVAELSEECPGYLRIEDLKAQFARGERPKETDVSELAVSPPKGDRGEGNTDDQK